MWKHRWKRRCVCDGAERGGAGAETGRYHGDGVRGPIRDPSDGHILHLHRFHLQRGLLGSNRHIRGLGVPVSGSAVLHRSMPVSSPGPRYERVLWRGCGGVFEKLRSCGREGYAWGVLCGCFAWFNTAMDWLCDLLCLLGWFGNMVG